MKINITTKDNIKKISARDVRNYIASITKNDAEINKVVLSHDPKDKHLIFVKPYHHNCVIIDYYNRYNLDEKIAKAIRSNTKFFHTVIQDVEVSPFEYIIPVKQTCSLEYGTRTPIVLTANNNEIRFVYHLYKHQDKKKIESMLQTRINRSIQFAIKRLLNIDYYPDVRISLVDYYLQNIIFETSEGVKEPFAIKANFISNTNLPQFVGYKNGYGWGQILLGRY